jgi:hypothetical protein
LRLVVEVTLNKTLEKVEEHSFPDFRSISIL